MPTNERKNYRVYKLEHANTQTPARTPTHRVAFVLNVTVYTSLMIFIILSILYAVNYLIAHEPLIAQLFN